MSNRLSEAGHMPLMPEPLLAAQAGAAFSASRLQTMQVLRLGKAFFELPADLWNVVHRLGNAIDNAMRLRDVAGMDDHMLADIGVRRDQLPGLFVDGRLADVTAGARAHRKSYPTD